MPPINGMFPGPAWVAALAMASWSDKHRSKSLLAWQASSNFLAIRFLGRLTYLTRKNQKKHNAYGDQHQVVRKHPGITASPCQNRVKNLFHSQQISEASFHQQNVIILMRQFLRRGSHALLSNSVGCCIHCLKTAAGPRSWHPAFVPSGSNLCFASSGQMHEWLGMAY